MVNDALWVKTLASVIAAGSPLVFAGIGEMLNEKAGITNLSLDGSILLSAMAGFVAAYASGSVLWGFAAAMAVGSIIALIVASSSIALKQDQVAVGFVLTLLCTDLSTFLGKSYVSIPGPSVPHLTIPVLAELPVIGPMFFDQNIVVYASFILVLAAWFWINHTRQGLNLRAIGERPESAFARGLPVNRMRYIYTAIGGALVGCAGAAYSLSVKLGWSQGHTAGFGWVALAIVIFGGWRPVRVALGAYLFGALKSLGSILQPVYPNIPSQVFQAAPFALMVVALLVVSASNPDKLGRYLPTGLRRALAHIMDASGPSGLGKRFEQD